MNKAGKYIVGGAVALVAVQAVRKGVAASKAVPKFLFPRNFKVKNWFLSFDMPFRIVNTDTTAYTVQSLGGRINYDAGKAGAGLHIGETEGHAALAVALAAGLLVDRGRRLTRRGVDGV